MTKEEIRQIRKRLGISQELFARVLGVSSPCLQRWEYGLSSPTYIHNDIMLQIRMHMDTIKTIEERSSRPIGDIIREIYSTDNGCYALYRLLHLLFGVSL